MAVQRKPIKDMVRTQGYKFCLFGPTGSGKTKMTETCPSENRLVISAESGLMSIGNSDADGVHVSSNEDLLEVYGNLFTKKWSDDWVFLDSISDIGETISIEEYKNFNGDARKASPETDRKVVAITKKFRDLQGVNVVFIAKSVDVQTDFTSCSKLMMPGNKLADQLPYLFDYVFYLHHKIDENGEFKNRIQCQPSERIPWCKHRTPGNEMVLDMFEKADWGHIVKKIKGE